MGEPLDEAGRERVRRRLARLAWLLDARFEVAGVKVGLDALIGLIPGVGDLVTTLISLYIVLEAGRLGATRRRRATMLLRLGLDFVAGSVPGLGDLFDVFYKANLKNLRSIGIEPAPPGKEPHKGGSGRVP